MNKDNTYRFAIIFSGDCDRCDTDGGLHMPLA